jgi:hypothetical protein
VAADAFPKKETDAGEPFDRFLPCSSFLLVDVTNDFPILVADDSPCGGVLDPAENLAIAVTNGFASGRVGNPRDNISVRIANRAGLKNFVVGDPESNE